MNDQQTLARFDAAVQALRARGPTLIELAQAAIAADDAERAFLFSEEPADEWQGVGDRRDIDLHGAKTDAVTAFLAALERETGIDRTLLDKIGVLL